MADKAAKRSQRQEEAKMQGMTAEEWTALENEKKKEQAMHRKQLQSAIALVAKGDKATKEALEKSMIRGGSPGKAGGEDGASLLSA